MICIDLKSRKSIITIKQTNTNEMRSPKATLQSSYALAHVKAIEKKNNNEIRIAARAMYSQ